jgi:hypothetical protein
MSTSSNTHAHLSRSDLFVGQSPRNWRGRVHHVADDSPTPRSWPTVRLRTVLANDDQARRHLPARSLIRVTLASAGHVCSTHKACLPARVFTQSDADRANGAAIRRAPYPKRRPSPIAPPAVCAAGCWSSWTRRMTRAAARSSAPPRATPPRDLEPGRHARTIPAWRLVPTWHARLATRSTWCNERGPVRSIAPKSLMRAGGAIAPGNDALGARDETPRGDCFSPRNRHGTARA